MKEAKRFTRENPVTKIEIYNCFLDAVHHVFVQRKVVDAKMEIGDNCVKYMVKNGFMDHLPGRNIDWFKMTPDGQRWLVRGLQRYLELHPERLGELTKGGPFKLAKPAIRRVRKPPEG